MTCQPVLLAPKRPMASLTRLVHSLMHKATQIKWIVKVERILPPKELMSFIANGFAGSEYFSVDRRSRLVFISRMNPSTRGFRANETMSVADWVGRDEEMRVYLVPDFQGKSPHESRLMLLRSVVSKHEKSQA